jgi:hypothetical protein
MKLAKYLAIPGMLSPIIYTIAWIIGGIIVSGYNHIRDDVSSLYAVGAPSRPLFVALFISAAALLFISSLLIHWGINKGDGLIVGPILYVLGTLIGLVVSIFFPLDEGGEMTTIFGKLHLILIVISGILVLASMVFFWLRTKKLEDWKFFSWFSIIIVPITIITLVLSIVFAGGPYMGLVERFMVTAYEIYYFVISLMIFIKN